MELISQRRQHVVRWQRDKGVHWAHRDGLVIALVPSRDDFDRALGVLRSQLTELRRQEPATAGKLILDAEGDWQWPDTGAIDFDRYADDFSLAPLRVSLSLADGEALEEAGNRQFAEHSEVLGWMQKVVDDRYHG